MDKEDAELPAPEAPATDFEKRAAAALREALTPPEGTTTPRSAEGRFLAAHLRLPTAEDSLGEVRAWRMARAARETVQNRRKSAAQRSGSFTRVTRSLTSTGGLLAAAALLLIVSWLIVGQSQPSYHQEGPVQGRGQGPAAVGARRPGEGRGADARLGASSERAAEHAAHSLMFRRSLKAEESPSRRLELMIEARLAELRSRRAVESERGPGAAVRSLAATFGGVP